MDNKQIRKLMEDSQMLTVLGLWLIAMAALAMIVAGVLLFVAHAQRPDYQTNLPYGLWARTRGGVLEIGHYREPANQHSGGWTGVLMWTSPHAIMMNLPILGGRCGVAATLEAPYRVRIAGHQFDTRDGPRVILRDESYHESICGESSDFRRKEDKS
jgi:hypothetical protein